MRDVLIFCIVLIASIFLAAQRSQPNPATRAGEIAIPFVAPAAK